eukprot:TRINITY_DN3009_c0_g1_i1.p1 TRINITY_DN3009_c0_g1~~TRINITY_DN3009_c0_g1_i1.p1  ORF type:complete len:1166 (+),score=291.06 TRINITY_DN3009_c0_g1_i1:38-3499(+)
MSLSKSNPCGFNLLQLCSRGNAILAELFRLSERIPSIFYLDSKEDISLYKKIIFDFSYLDKIDLYEYEIHSNPELSDIDTDFPQIHGTIIKRIFKLFESIAKYYQDLMGFIDEVQEGVFLQYSFENILQDGEMRQVLCESIYLFGCMLLLLDVHFPGVIRERIIISFYRYNGGSDLDNFNDVLHLCRRTDYDSTKVEQKKGYPEKFFNRFEIPKSLVRMVVGSLRSCDLYELLSAYPDADHRTVALSRQSAVLVVILYFDDSILNNDHSAMRSIVDKFFTDNWVISIYMGHLFDLQVQWRYYKAAKDALNNTLNGNLVLLNDRYASEFEACIKELDDLLVEGVLSEEYVLSHIQPLIDIVRRSNVTLRYYLLTMNAYSSKYREKALGTMNKNQLLNLLLKTSELEHELIDIIERVLKTSEDRFAQLKKRASTAILELGTFFNGSSNLQGITKNDAIVKWSSDISNNILSVNMNDSMNASRTIDRLIFAIADIETKTSDVERSVPKQLRTDARDYLKKMHRILLVSKSNLTKIRIATDLSYAWRVLPVFVTLIQQRIEADAKLIIPLRSLFLKLVSVLDLPLMRITQSQSDDLVSVANVYSSMLLRFVKNILQIIPEAIFKHLNTIAQILQTELKPLESEIPRNSILDVAQTDVRFKLANLTNDVCVLARGILAMKKTFVGAVELNPKEMLLDGIKRELVKQISFCLNDLVFNKKGNDFDEVVAKVRNRLISLQTSLEYIQDYATLPGMHVWYTQYDRVVNFFVDKECSKFLAISPSSAMYDDDLDIPIFNHIDDRLSFVGRLVDILINPLLEDSTTFVLHHLAFMNRETRAYVLGLHNLFDIINGLGQTMLNGIDRYLGFHTVAQLNIFYRKCLKRLDPAVREGFSNAWLSFYPLKCQPKHPKLYESIKNWTSVWYKRYTPYVMRMGINTLFRFLIRVETSYVSNSKALHLKNSLKVVNNALFRDFKEKIEHKDSCDYFPGGSDDQPFNFEFLSLFKDMLSCVGLEDPLITISRLPPTFPFIEIILFGMLLHSLERLIVDPSWGTLVWDDKRWVTLDGTILAVGFGVILKQFHQGSSERFFGICFQYIRWLIFENETNQLRLLNKKEFGIDLPEECIKLCIFLQTMLLFGKFDVDSMFKSLPKMVFERFFVKK